jgi:hypothetical protein
MSTFTDNDDKKVAASKTVFKNLPVFFSCSNCDYAGYTIVEQKATYISYIMTVIFMFLFGILFSIILMPVIILLTRNYQHKCPSCLKEVGSDNKLLSIFDLQDKVVSVGVGEFGMVLTRKIVLGIFLTLLLIFTIYRRVDFHAHHHHLAVSPIKEDWPTFLKECGRDPMLNGGAATAQMCRAKYLEKTAVGWKGYVIRVEDYRNSLYSFIHHAVVILIKMEPSESEYYPDILLAIDSEKAEELKETLVSLNRGSEIGYNATIVTIGDDLKTRHFHVVNLWKGEGYKDVPEHIHEHGRYADKPRFFKGPIASAADQNS